MIFLKGIVAGEKGKFNAEMSAYESAKNEGVLAADQKRYSNGKCR